MKADSLNPEKPATRQWDLFVGLLPLLALSPMLVFAVAAVWTRDAMRFSPLVLIVLSLMVGLRIRHSSLSTHPVRVWVAISLLIAATLSYLYAVWAFSPWLSHFALILVFAAWALGRLGNIHWATVGGWTALLATTLPLPWGWDRGLLDWLQFLGTWCSAKALDALAIPCLQNGGMLESRDLQLFADEVCGGLGSFYAFIAFAISLSLWQHSSLIAAVKTLIFVPLWTVLGHFLRIFGIIALQEYTARDFSSGWDFRILEAVSALIVLLLIWATSRFFRRIYEPIPVADAEFGPVFSGLNKLFCWPQPDPFEDLEPEDEYERKQYAQRKAERLAKQRTYGSYLWIQNNPSAWTVRGLAVVIVVVALFPVRSLASQGLSGLSFGRPSMSLAQVKQLANEELLPQTLEGGWQRSGFQTVRRNARSRKGEFSIVWHFRSTQSDFDASIDLPFLGWNDPAGELAQLGWKTDETRIEIIDGWPYAECAMENELGGKATIFYCLFTPQGEPYANLPKQLLSEAEASFESELQSEQSANAVTYQFQVFSESGVELARQDRDALRAKFLELRKIVLAARK